MDTIKELYYGNLHPYDRDIKKGSELDQLANLVLRLEAELKETLNQNETELFNKLKDAWSELTCLNECENFINGFRLGVRLTAESFQEKEYGKTEQRSAALSSTIYNDTIDKNQYLYEVFLFLFRILQS